MKSIIDNLLYVSPNRGLLYVTDLEVEYPYVPQGAEDDVINPDGSTKVDESECFHCPNLLQIPLRSLSYACFRELYYFLSPSYVPSETATDDCNGRTADGNPRVKIPPTPHVRPSHKLEHLSCFLPGLLALGAYQVRPFLYLSLRSETGTNNVIIRSRCIRFLDRLRRLRIPKG
jgi:hypothetical protein